MSASAIRRSLPALIGLFFYAAALVALPGLAGLLLTDDGDATRGVWFGEPPTAAWSAVYPLGVNVALERYQTTEELRRVLELIQAGGFRWIRQTFPWAQIEPRPGRYDWATWDRIVQMHKASGSILIAVLDTSPAWARESMDADNPHAPPRDFEDYFDFVRAFVARYGDQIDFYQVWDEPNIYPHWGERSVDPRAYVDMLRSAATAIRQGDPSAVVLSAGLAPNIEEGGPNMSDALFLQEMYEAGARSYFDILAIQPYGFWSGPEDRRAELSLTNFSRAILLRQVMERNRDGDKAIFAVEFGWNALPAVWAGRPSLWGSDAESLQARRTLAALERAQREWPWMGAMLIAHLQPNAPLDDPVWGFALLDSSGHPRLLYRELATWSGGAGGTVPFYPGAYSIHDPAYAPVQWWADLDRGSLVFDFWGTRVDLKVQPPFTAESTLDSLPARQVVVEGSSVGKVTLAAGLPAGVHTLRLAVSKGEVTAVTVQREANLVPLLASLGLILVASLMVSWRSLRLLASAPMRELAAELDRRYEEIPEVVQAALLGGAILAYYYTPNNALSLAWLVVVGLLIYLRLDGGLIYVTFSIPFFLLPKSLGGKAFALVEILTLMCFLAWGVRSLIRSLANPQGSIIAAPAGFGGRLSWPLLQTQVIAWLRTFNSLDAAVIFFSIAAVFSLPIAENFGVAAREFRVVILEPILFYWMVRSVPRANHRRLLDALIWAGVAVSCVGLYQYFVSGDVITAEGVRRIKAFYGSPNNLALFLVRVAPVALAFALGSSGMRRRWFCAAASALLLIAMMLTYSRGALFLGLPVGLLALGALRGRRTLMASLAGVALLAGLALLAARPERVASLVDLNQGTTFRRLKLWEASLEMLADHPWFGVGLDNFLYIYPRYLKAEAAQEPDLSHPHNLILHWWLSLGLPGVIALVWFMSEFARRGLRLYRGLRDPTARLIVLALLASMAGSLAHGLVDQSYFLVDLAFVFFLSLGMVRRMERLEYSG
ncbi:MAG: O-antigen ligase family protein [Chloroflexi bacterium]|nr:O-antigen ligase family protein [Chloroflexota bacterium]